MPDARIQNARKDRDGDITHVGVAGSWIWPIAQVISAIENKSNTFHVFCPQRADVIVRQTTSGRKFLKTTADTTAKSNLEALPPL